MVIVVCTLKGSFRYVFCEGHFVQHNLLPPIFWLVSKLAPVILNPQAPATSFSVVFLFSLLFSYFGLSVFQTTGTQIRKHLISPHQTSLPLFLHAGLNMSTTLQISHGAYFKAENGVCCFGGCFITREMMCNNVAPWRITVTCYGDVCCVVLWMSVWMKELVT